MPAELQFEYYAGTTTVINGAAQAQVDFDTLLTARGRDVAMRGRADYLHLVSDVAISVRVNEAAGDVYDLAGAEEFIIPGGLMQISCVWLARAGGGNATVKIFCA